MTGPFWASIHGDAPMPRAAQTLGFEFVAYDPDAATITVAFIAGRSSPTR